MMLCDICNNNVDYDSDGTEELMCKDCTRVLCHHHVAKCKKCREYLCTSAEDGCFEEADGLCFGCRP